MSNNRPSRLVLPGGVQWPDGRFRPEWPLGPTQIAGAVASAILGLGTLTSSGSSGVAPSAPTQHQVLLQGMAVQETYGVGTGYQSATNDYLPAAQGQLTVGWLAPTVGAGQSALAGFKIYINTGSGWNPTPRGTVTFSTALTNYSSYVTASTVGSVVWPYATEVNCAWTDSAAANASGYPYGAGPDHYAGGFYLYRVTAVDINGTEGPPSASSVLRYIYGGLIGTNATAGGAGTVGGQFCGGTFNGTADFANTAGGTTPLGQSKSLRHTCTTGFDLVNPFAAVGCDHWNANVKAYDTFRLSVKAAQAASTLQFSCLVRNPSQPSGDQQITGPGGGQLLVVSTAYGTLVNGQWVTLYIPRSDIMTDNSLGLLSAWYKANLQTQKSTGGEVFYYEADFINRTYP